MFGTNEQFAQLCEQIRGKQMKIVLDAVFNHTSVHHPWFDIKQEGQGAYGNPNSDFVIITSSKVKPTTILAGKGLVTSLFSISKMNST